MTGTQRGQHWPADFSKSGDLRLERANYGRPGLLEADDGSDAYAVYKTYYQLCGAQAADTVPGARYKEKPKGTARP